MWPTEAVGLLLGMGCIARLVDFGGIGEWRERYRREMDCQIVHDSLHARVGWTREFALEVEGELVGYGSVVESGPWVGRPTVFEFYLGAEHRLRAFDAFEALMKASGAVGIEVQTNDPLLTVMLHTYGKHVACEKIVFRDAVTTAYRRGEMVFREARRADVAGMTDAKLDGEAKWLVELGGRIVAAGGVLYHYNRPYGDVYMAVDERFRGRGIGTFLVQELKRVCREGGSVPAARCNPTNVASRKTLQKAGFVPCANILVGQLM